MKKKNVTAIGFTVAIGIISACCIIATVLLCVSGVSPDIYSEKEPTSVQGSELSKTYDYGDGYIKSIIWVGDKTLSQLSACCPSIDLSQLLCGEDGSLRLDYNLSTTPVLIANEKKYASVAKAAEEIKPKYMIITVGLENGVGYCTEEKFKEYYSNLIESIKESSPDTKIILQSVFPVSRSVEKANPSVSNDRIRQVNSWINSLSTELSVRYLNTHSTLTDEKGFLKQEYDSGDGMTLNESGYGAMIEYVKTHGYK